MNEPCPLCNHPFLVQGGGQKNPKLLCGRGKECGYSRPLEEAGEGAGSGEPGETAGHTRGAGEQSASAAP